MAAAAGIFDPEQPGTLLNPVRPDGTFDERVRSYGGRSYEGRFVKDPALAQELIDDLRERGLLLRASSATSTPTRTAGAATTPLIYYAKTSWYIRDDGAARRAAGRERDRRLAPAARQARALRRLAVQQRRLGDLARALLGHAAAGVALRAAATARRRLLRGARRSAPARRSPITTARMWTRCVRLPARQRRAECRRHGPEASVRAADARVPEVIDVWFDSGAMPFAQHHHPFEHELEFERGFPADFICEAQDQTRGWFYSLLAVSDAARARRAPYRNVVCLGLILDAEGQKMSKSKGNTVEPWQVLDAYGADAFRWYFFTSKQPWDGYRFSTDAIGEGVRLFLKQLWSTYYFYALYAQASASSCAARAGERRRARPPRSGDGRAGPLGAVAHGGHGAARGRAPGGLRRDVGRSRDRDARGRAVQLVRAPLAAALLGRRRGGVRDAARCLLTVAKLLAPLCPFIADEIYDNLDGDARERAPLRLPAPRAAACATRSWRQAMALARETVRLGLGRARQGEDQGAPAARRGGRRGARARARGDRSARRRSCARS